MCPNSLDLEKKRPNGTEHVTAQELAMLPLASHPGLCCCCCCHGVGHFQYSYFDGNGIPGDKPYAETISWPRLGDDTYKLEFIAEKKGHY